MQYKKHIFVIAAITLITVAVLVKRTLSSEYYHIVTIKEGQMLSGDASVPIAAHGSFDFITLWVDHKEYGSENLQGEGHDRTGGFSIPTYEFANGRHTLEIGLGNRIFDSRHVIFQNERQGLKATRLVHAGTPASITGTVYPNGPWKATLQNAHKQTLRTWSGDGYAINLTWDGKDRSGRPVNNRTYHLVVITQTLGESFTCPVVKDVPPLK